MPQWHTVPLQQGQWLEAAEIDFQPLNWVKGWEIFRKKAETIIPIMLTIGPLPFNSIKANTSK
jgi:hypothetical protein